MALCKTWWLLPASQGCQYNQTPPSASQPKVLPLQALSKSLRQNNWYHHRRKLNTLCPCLFFHYRWWLWPFQKNQYQSENTMQKHNYVDLVGYETKFCWKNFLFKVYWWLSSDKKNEDIIMMHYIQQMQPFFRVFNRLYQNLYRRTAKHYPFKEKRVQSSIAMLPAGKQL